MSATTFRGQMPDAWRLHVSVVRVMQQFSEFDAWAHADRATERPQKAAD